MHIYVVGNCQAEAVAGLLKEAMPEAIVDALQVHLFTADDLLAHQRRVSEADIILLVPVAPSYRGEELSSDWITDQRKSGADVLVWPSIYYRGDQPASFTNQLSDERTPYVDGNVVAEFISGRNLPAVSRDEREYRRLILSRAAQTRD